MNSADYSNMSRSQLRAYMLEHREDQAASEAYMDRLAVAPSYPVPMPEEPEAFAEWHQGYQTWKRDQGNTN